VIVVMAVTIFGGYALAAALSGPAEPPMDVGGLVRLQPAAGWEAARIPQASEPVHSQGLTRGSGNLYVYAAPFDGTPEQLADVYVGRVLEQRSVRLWVAAPVVVRLNSTIAAVRFGYGGIFESVGAPVEGEVTVLVSPAGTGVVYDGWAPEPLLQDSLGQIHAMEDGAVVS
jgi:hypothetical protein